MLAAISVGGDAMYGFLYTVHGGLGMYMVALLFLYIYLEGL